MLHRPIGDRSIKRASWREKTSFASNASGNLSGQAPDPRLVARKAGQRRDACSASGPHGPFGSTPRPIRPSTECASSSQCQRSEDKKDGEGQTSSSPAVSAFFTSSAFAPDEPDESHRKDRKTQIPPDSVETSAFKPWWSQTGSNRRPHACKARALPTELWPRLNTRRAPKGFGGPGRT